MRWSAGTGEVAEVVTWGIAGGSVGLAGGMFDDRLRPVSGRALRPLVAVAGSTPPWALTVAGLAVGLAAAGAAAVGWWGAASVGWLVNRLFDGLDGEVARAQGRAGRLGGLWDLTADVAVYAAIPLGVAAGVGTMAAWQASAALLAACYLNITTATVVGGLATAGSGAEPARVPLSAGLVEGAETIVLYTAILVVGPWRVELVALAAAAIASGAVVRAAGAGRRSVA